MSLSPGVRLGAYEVLARLGAGGMGEVYRARDTTLGRDVALKTLPESFTHDSERLARFRREAQVLAALNHPHIGSIYGFEEAGAHRFLVLELVDGDTLADRVARGPLPVDEAVSIARQVAEALEAAHEKGIVHRDLKPANIALTGQDRVKVLDFGLAKPNDPSATSGVDSPTLTSPALLTGLGVILGTAAYMSPEQAKGRPADKRTDIWAFGCVFFEMLTGKRAFEGDDVSDTLASVLRGAPAWDALPPELPPAIRGLLESCLQKDPRERIGDISTALYVLKQTHAAATKAPVRERASRSWLRAALFVLGGAAIGGALVALLWPRQPPPAIGTARFEVEVPDARGFFLSRRAVAISPDGTRIVFVAGGRLYLRSLTDFETRPIPGADPGIQPAFSPDGQSIVYWADPGLRRIAVAGGVSISICDAAPAPYGVTWTEGGINFVQPGGSIMRVSPNGGTPEVLVRINPAEGLVQGAELLPDGDTILFTIGRGGQTSNFWDRGTIVAQSLKTGRRKTLVEGGSDGHYVPTGHLVYAVEGTMMAVGFDITKLEVTSGPIPVVEGVRRAATAGGAESHFAFSTSGTLVYLPGAARGGRDSIFLFDRRGEGLPLDLTPGTYAFPRVSPDGKWIAVETSENRESSVSLYELSGASSIRRLTFGGNNRLPIWSADGRRVAFQSDREGDLGIFWQSVNGGPVERLTKAEPGTAHVPEAWSPRDDVFLFSITKNSETTLWSFSLVDRKASRFDDVRSTSFPTDAVFSPDGKWVAYQAGEPGTGEATTYVQPFPPTGVKYQVARGGRPAWSRDGREIFFIPSPGQFLSVSVQTEPTFTFTNPTPLVRRFGLAPPTAARSFDVLPDGRIVAIADANDVGGQNSPRVRVVLNWFNDLEAKAPTATSSRGETAPR